MVEPSVNVVKSFLDRSGNTEGTKTGSEDTKLGERDLWTRYVCEVSRFFLGAFSIFDPATELSYVQFLVRRVEIRSLGVLMNGSNTNKVDATENGFHGCESLASSQM